MYGDTSGVLSVFLTKPHCCSALRGLKTRKPSKMFARTSYVGFSAFLTSRNWISEIVYVRTSSSTFRIPNVRKQFKSYFPLFIICCEGVIGTLPLVIVPNHFIVFWATIKANLCFGVNSPSNSLEMRSISRFTGCPIHLST